MSKALPPLSTSQGHNNSYTAGTSAAYGGAGGQSTGRSFNSTTPRTVGPIRSVPKLPQIDFTLGPLQERTLPSYNDLEDPHLYPYWRRQESLVYERQARREEQLRRERQDARQREASRRRFQERRRREREALAAKKGVRSEAAEESAPPRQGTRSGSRKSQASRSGRGSRRASTRHESADQYPTEADQYGQQAAADESFTTDSDHDSEDDHRDEQEALWEHLEGFMAPAPAGVPLRALPLMEHRDFVTLAKEHQQLSALEARPATRLADLAAEMNTYAESMAREQIWAEREAFLGRSIDGVPLRTLPLDDSEEFLELETARRDLDGQSSPSRRQRIATVEGRMQEICHDLVKKQTHGAYPVEDGDAAADSTADDEVEPREATEPDVWADREEYLGAYPEGVALRDIPLDDNEAFLTLEAERRHLLRDGGRREHGAAITKMEERLNALCEEMARDVKAKEANVQSRYDDDDFEADEDDDADDNKSDSDKDAREDRWVELGDERDESASASSSKRTSEDPDAAKWAELGDDDEADKDGASEKSSPVKPPRLFAGEEEEPRGESGYNDDDFEDEEEEAYPTEDANGADAKKRSVDNLNDNKWAELGDDDEDEKEEAKSASAPHLSAVEEKAAEEKADDYTDDDFEDDDDADKASHASDSKPANASRGVDQWAELGDDDDEDKKEEAKSASAPHLSAAEEKADGEKADDYTDDDFEDDDDEAAAASSSKRSSRSVNLDDKKWDELGDDEEREEKKSNPISSKRSSAAEQKSDISDDDIEPTSSVPVSSKRRSNNPDDSKWDELGDDERGVVDTEDKKSSVVSTQRSSVSATAKSSTTASSRRSSASDVKAADKDPWAELGDDVVEDEAEKKSVGASTPTSSKADDAYGEDDDWDEM